MTWTAFVRGAKLVALIGFALPWLVLSCSNQEIATVSGVDLAVGRIEVTNPLTGEVERQEIDQSMPVIFAVAAIVAGLAASFLERRRIGAALTLATSLLAAAASFQAITSIREAPQQAFDREMRQAEQEGRSSPLAEQLGADVLGMIEVEEQPGYWVTLASLLGAAAFSAAGLAGLRIRLSLGSPPNSRGRG
jgi:hypothetical protein